VFRPDPALMGGTKYTVTVDPDLEAVDGATLAEGYSWAFTTTAPIVTSVTPTDPTFDVPDPAVALGGCPGIADPAGLTDAGTIKGPTGEYRVCVLPNLISRSMTLEKVPGVLYALNGRTDVGGDCGPAPAADGTASPCKLTASGTTENAAVTLTIQPGVIIFSKTGTSWLAVNRGNKLNAVGTATLPIVFTSQDNVLGLATNGSQGKWGGVVLMGRAPVTDCNLGGPPDNGGPNQASCWRDTEGSSTAAYFGGNSPADSSGTMDYVQIRYSGFILGANVELQSLTLEGTGSGTVIRHIHSHNSSDDGVEIFGGRANVRYFVVTGADDDTFDVDTGYKGTIQYAIGVHKTAFGDSMLELDSANSATDNVPRTNLKFANFTLVSKGSNSNGVAMLMRGGADVSLVNGVLVAPSTLSCLKFDGTGTPSIISAANATYDKLGPPVFKSVAMQCSTATPYIGSGGISATEVQTTFTGGSASNTVTLANTLTNVFVNGAAETAVGATDPKTIDAAFDTTTYIGAVRDSADTWYQGWTCNSSTANFVASPATRQLCTSLPSLL
jgi:hypothetical protein